MEITRIQMQDMNSERIMEIGLSILGRRSMLGVFMLSVGAALLNAEQADMEFSIKSFEGSILPLSYLVENGQSHSSDPLVAIEVLSVLVDGNAMQPSKQVASVEVENEWSASTYEGWRTVDFILNEHPNFFFSDASASSNLMVKWSVPDDWKTLEVLYQQRAESGEILKKYLVKAERD